MFPGASGPCTKSLKRISVDLHQNKLCRFLAFLRVFDGEIFGRFKFDDFSENSPTAKFNLSIFLLICYTIFQ